MAHAQWCLGEVHSSGIAPLLVGSRYVVGASALFGLQINETLAMFVMLDPVPAGQWFLDLATASTPRHGRQRGRGSYAAQAAQAAKAATEAAGTPSTAPALGSGMYHVVINPRILNKGSELYDVIGIEGCLSLPDYIAVVRRNRWLEVAYHNLEGREITARITGGAQPFLPSVSRLVAFASGVESTRTVLRAERGGRA